MPFIIPNAFQKTNPEQSRTNKSRTGKFSALLFRQIGNETRNYGTAFAVRVSVNAYNNTAESELRGSKPKIKRNKCRGWVLNRSSRVEGFSRVAEMDPRTFRFVLGQEVILGRDTFVYNFLTTGWGKLPKR